MRAPLGKEMALAHFRFLCVQHNCQQKKGSTEYRNFETVSKSGLVYVWTDTTHLTVQGGYDADSCKRLFAVSGKRCSESSLLNIIGCVLPNTPAFLSSPLQGKAMTGAHSSLSLWHNTWHEGQCCQIQGSQWIWISYKTQNFYYNYVPHNIWDIFALKK